MLPPPLPDTELDFRPFLVFGDLVDVFGDLVDVFGDLVDVFGDLVVFGPLVDFGDLVVFGPFGDLVDLQRGRKDRVGVSSGCMGNRCRARQSATGIAGPSPLRHLDTRSISRSTYLAISSSTNIFKGTRVARRNCFNACTLAALALAALALAALAAFRILRRFWRFRGFWRFWRFEH